MQVVITISTIVIVIVIIIIIVIVISITINITIFMQCHLKRVCIVFSFSLQCSIGSSGDTPEQPSIVGTTTRMPPCRSHTRGYQ